MVTHGSAADAARADKLAYYLLKGISRAQREHALFADGDRLLVAVSGGKDSLSLLDLLRRRQTLVREHYTLAAAHVHTDFHCGRAVPLDWLAAWCRAREIPLVVRELRVAEEVRTTHLSKCFRCAWNRRKVLFELAAELGCDKLAFGHHADDIAETTLMNLFYNASIRRMEPRMQLFDGRLTVIRPLAYIEERDIVPFALASGFPLEGQPCPEGEHSRRNVVKRLLREVEADCHGVKRHIYRAVDRYQACAEREEPPARK